MKKVFKIGYQFFWACNGQRVRRVIYSEQDADGRLWLRRHGKYRMQIEMVAPPSGRCPHCGKKLPA